MVQRDHDVLDRLAGVEPDGRMTATRPSHRRHRGLVRRVRRRDDGHPDPVGHTRRYPGPLVGPAVGGEDLGPLVWVGEEDAAATGRATCGRDPVVIAEATVADAVDEKASTSAR